MCGCALETYVDAQVAFSYIIVLFSACADLVGDCNTALAEETAVGLVQLLQLIHAQLPGTHILALALLPKGEVWPNRCSDAITLVNGRLEVRWLHHRFEPN